MNLLPIAGIDVGKRFSEMAVLSPDNAVIARLKIYHDASSNIDKAVEVHFSPTNLLGLFHIWFQRINSANENIHEIFESIA